MLRELGKARAAFTGNAAEAAAAEAGLAAAAAKTAALRAELEGKSGRMKISSAKDGRRTTDAEGLQEALAPLHGMTVGVPPPRRRRRRPPHAGLSAGGGGQSCGDSSSRRTRRWRGARPCARRSMRSTPATTPSA